MKKLFTVVFAIVIVTGCVDPIALRLDNGAGALVVDGLITDRQGPHYIKLSRSINFDNAQQLRVYSVPERNATVVVSDDSGASETAFEIEPGSYVLSSLRGHVGRTYTLEITTAQGQKYRSQPEMMVAAVKPDRVEYEFGFYDYAVITGTRGSTKIPLDGFFIYAVVNDPPKKGNYHRWYADGTFEYFSLIDEDTLKQCWAPSPRLDSKIELTDDTYSDGQPSRQFVCIVPYNRPTQFLVRINQLSLTENAFLFWRNSAAQHSTTGSLFDPPPAAIAGNIFNVNAADEPVLGFFGASAYLETTFLLDRLKDANLKPPSREIPIKPGNCKVQEPGATNKKPAGFR